MKVYVVTSGEYSDYHIDAVFLDRKKALQYCAANGICEDVSVEEWETADETIDCKKSVNRKYIGVIEHGYSKILDKPYTFEKTGCKFYHYGTWFPWKPMENKAKFICVFPINMKIDKVHKAIQEHFEKWVYEISVEAAGGNS